MKSCCKTVLAFFGGGGGLLYVCVCMYVRPQPLADHKLVCERLLSPQNGRWVMLVHSPIPVLTTVKSTHGNMSAYVCGIMMRLEFIEFGTHMKPG